jgi:hypothetical protein
MNITGATSHPGADFPPEFCQIIAPPKERAQGKPGV